LKDELEEESQLSEIGYYRNKRVVLSLDNIDRSEIVPAESFDSDHFIVTGGGNGITSEIVRVLSAKIKASFTIIGRTQLPPDIEELSELDQASLELKRTALYHSSKKVRKQAPSEIEKEYGSMIKAISVYKLMKEIRENGNEVQYYSCDIRDYDGLKQVFQRSESSFGPANVIIHGAGAEKSRLIGQKTVSEFEEVFDVKAKGLCNLYRLADKEKLKVLIGFSSIAGRFGNRAQLDYCAANNFVSSFTAVVRSRNLRTLSISWSGWKDTGMAWRNEFVKVNAEEMGIHLIEPARGSQEFLNILLSSVNRNELVISRGLGIFAGQSKWLNMKNTAPLIDWISKKDGKIQKVHKVLSVKADPVVGHHRLGKVPLVPAVVFMEIGAQAHSLIYGKKQQYCFRDIKLDNPLKLFNEKPQEVIFIPQLNTSSELIDAVLYNNFESKIGKGKLIRINSMKIYGAVGEYEDLRALKSAENIDMAEIGLKEYLELAAARFGNSISLGPLFMDDKASKINGFKCNRQSIVCTVALSEEQITNKKYNLQQLLINPAFADSLMEACCIHSSMDSYGIYLPWKVGEFGVVKVPKSAGRFRTFAKMLYEGNGEKTYDVILYGDNDEVYYYARNVIVKRIAQ
jgi:NAD(P)-dependent dehydrogenase (short-subunit alcohol dehydrogenase family)